VDAPRVRRRQPVAAQKDGQLAQAGRVAPRSRDGARDRGADAGNFAHAFRGVVEHFAERVAEMFRDSAREPRADAFYFRSEVALYRDGAGRAQRFEIDDVKLFAETLMLLEAADSADGRAHFEAGEIADDRDAAKIAMLIRHDHDRDRIAVAVVNEQDLIEDAFERLGRCQRLCHGNRITRDGGGVQLAALARVNRRASRRRWKSIWTQTPKSRG